MHTNISKDCLKCSRIPCINLYDIHEEACLGEGEIRALEKFSNPFDHKLHPPCLLGVAVNTLCEFLSALWFSDRKRTVPSTPFYLQGMRDLKATILLILTGHYRAAGAIMRSVLELYISGLYFDYQYLKAQSDDERNKIINEVKTGVRTNSSKWGFAFIKFLDRENVIRKETRANMGKLWNELCHYTHPKEFELPEKGYPVCPAIVSFVKKDYEKSLKLFQELLAVILEDIIFNAYCEKLEFIGEDKVKNITKNVVERLKSAEEDLEDVIEKPLLSVKLKNFINNRLKPLLE